MKIPFKIKAPLLKTALNIHKGKEERKKEKERNLTIGKKIDISILNSCESRNHITYNVDVLLEQFYDNDLHIKR